MRDFTIDIYKELLKSLQNQGYTFQTFEQFLKNPNEKVIILRHDVDDLRFNSLAFAKIQAEMGIVGTYYFRMVPQSFDKKVIKEIADLGHEIGYHYEDMDFAKGNPDEAIKLFEKHLNQLREIAPITTICMHGSPLSKYDNKDVFKKHNYRDFDIIGEPYFDIDFNKVFYITDTGRRWDGDKVSVRDKVNSAFSLSFSQTSEIIDAANKDLLPNQIMLTFHPQRWNDDFMLWSKELVLQNIKNIVKKYIYVKK